MSDERGEPHGQFLKVDALMHILGFKRHKHKHKQTNTSPLVVLCSWRVFSLPCTKSLLMPQSGLIFVPLRPWEYSFTFVFLLKGRELGSIFFSLVWPIVPSVTFYALFWWVFFRSSSGARSLSAPCLGVRWSASLACDLALGTDALGKKSICESRCLNFRREGKYISRLFVETITQCSWRHQNVS